MCTRTEYIHCRYMLCVWYTSSYDVIGQLIEHTDMMPEVEQSFVKIKAKSLPKCADAIYLDLDVCM